MATVKPAPFIGGTVGAAGSSPAALAVPAPGRYEIDTGRSAVTFSTRHLFGLALVCGSFAIRAVTVEVAEPVTDSQAVISRLRSVLTWRNEAERRVSGRVRAVSGACQGRCR